MSDAQRLRLQALARIVRKETELLKSTDARLFHAPLTPEMLVNLTAHADLSDRIEAYASRFARLQDTLGDKLIPAWLRSLEETPGAMIDNLNRAERLGMLASVDEWLGLRQLRNQMVHEYIEDPATLAHALHMAHAKLPILSDTAEAILNDLQSRGHITAT